jgi:small redox-active disulfide protein 2
MEVKLYKMKIKVLGTGCKNCKALEEATKKIVEELKLDAVVEKVEDIQQIMEYGIMSTPGLVINNKVVLSGRVPKPNEIKELLTQNQ